MGKRQGLFSTAIQTPRLIPFALLRFFFIIIFKIGLISFFFFFLMERLRPAKERGGCSGVLLAGVLKKKITISHGKVPDNMQGRRWMEVGHGEGWWVVSAQRKLERKRGRGCVWVRRRRRDPGGRLGKAAGVDGDGTGYLKGKATPCSALSSRWLWGCLVGGTGTESGTFGGARGGGGRLGTKDAQCPLCRDAGCGYPGTGRPRGAWLGGVSNPAPNGLILEPGGKNHPPRSRMWPLAQAMGQSSI